MQPRYRTFCVSNHFKKYTLFCVIGIILISTTSSARNRGENFKQPRSIGCNRRNQKFDGEEKCDTTTNCRYGGMCRKVTDITANGATIRVVIPSQIETIDLKEVDSHKRYRSRRRSSVLNPLYEKLERPPQEECVCNFPCGRRLNHQQVCGSNDKTYSSECHLRRDSCRCQTDITVKWNGSCQNATSSIHMDNDQYTRKCTNECRFGGECDRTGICRCHIECDVQTLAYLCGKDGRTYTNECHMKQSECRHQMKIGILHEGACSTEERRRRESQEFQRVRPTVNPCETLDCDAAVADPLCGSDEISYPNECVMRHASCIKEQEILVKHKGYCRQHFEVEIPTITKPVTSSEIQSLEIATQDPCVGIICHNNAVCIKHEEYDFICSCEEICDRMVSNIDIENPETDTSFRALAAMWPSARIFQARINDKIPNTNLYTAKTMDEDGVLEDHLDQMTSLAEEENSTSEPMVVEVQPEIIKLDDEPETKSVWTELINEDFDVTSDRVRIRKRRKRNSHRRRRGEYHETTRSKRSTGGMRSLFDQVLCGTDGKTYKNECEMRKKGCYEKKRITIAHLGACPMTIRKSTPSMGLDLTPTTASTVPTIPRVSEEKPEVEKVEMVDENDKRSFEADFTIPTTKPARKCRRGQRSRCKRKRGRGRRKQGGRSESRRSQESKVQLRDETINSGLLNELWQKEQAAAQKHLQSSQNESKVVFRDQQVDSDIFKNIYRANVPTSPSARRHKNVTVAANTSGEMNVEPFTIAPTEQSADEITNAVKKLNITKNLKTREEVVSDTFLYPLSSDIKSNSISNSSTEGTTRKTNRAVKDSVEERSENVPLKDYKSLWKAGKKKELLKNRVILAKKRLEHAKNRNSTRLHAANDLPERTTKSETELSAISLALAIGLGQLTVIMILVGLFIYMKKRKKLKDLPEINEKSQIDKKNESTNVIRPS